MKKILFIEDERALQETFKKVLTQEGFKMISALDGKIGIKGKGYDITVKTCKKGNYLMIAEELREIYKVQIANSGYPWIRRKKIEHIMIGKRTGRGGGYFYDLIFAARETKGGSPWFDSVLPRLKEGLERETASTVKVALDIVSGRATTIDKWMI